MGQNTSIYWASAQTAQRAKELAASRGISVSQLVSELIEEEHKTLIPPLEGVCPTCGAETTFTFLGIGRGLPDQEFKFYKCSNCDTTLLDVGIQEKEALTNV